MCRILCTNEMIAGVQSRPMTIAMMTESMIQASSRRHHSPRAGSFAAAYALPCPGYCWYGCG
jgi:hypothetical protein